MQHNDMNSTIHQLLSQQWTHLLKQQARRFAALPNAQYPGVYLIAYSGRNLEDQPIVLEDIFYVGMSNSDGGVRERLRGFINGIEKYRSHSGAKRFYKLYAQQQPFSIFSRANGGKQFFVASISIPCEVTKAKRTSDDLRKMGEVARLEYYVLAHIKNILGTEPELNKK
jgi:hypothetical protein